MPRHRGTHCPSPPPVQTKLSAVSSCQCGKLDSYQDMIGFNGLYVLDGFTMIMPVLTFLLQVSGFVYVVPFRKPVQCVSFVTFQGGPYTGCISFIIYYN